MNLAEIRKEKGLTQADVAAETGMTQQMYCYVETGRRRPSVSAAKRIAAVLGVDWTEFFEEEASA